MLVASCTLEITGPDGKTVRRVFAHSPISFGRHEPTVDVFLDDLLVSRHHGEIIIRPGAVEVRDCGSTNGIRTDEGPRKRFRRTVGQAFTAGCYRIRLVALTHSAQAIPIERPGAGWDVDSETPIALRTLRAPQRPLRKVSEPISGAY